MVAPYIDSGLNLRKFDVSAPDENYVWHRDQENRLVTILSGDGWCFQYENALPFVLKKGSKISIKENEYHRLLKGTTDLLVRITKTNK